MWQKIKELSITRLASKRGRVMTIPAWWFQDACKRMNVPTSKDFRVDVLTRDGKPNELLLRLIRDGQK